jgi:hypothetical protein
VAVIAVPISSIHFLFDHVFVVVTHSCAFVVVVIVVHSCAFVLFFDFIILHSCAFLIFLSFVIFIGMVIGMVVFVFAFDVAYGCWLVIIDFDHQVRCCRC